MAVSGRYVAVAIQLVGSLVVARLLSPTDFGLFSIAASVVAVTASVREFGITSYLVQVQPLDREALGRAVAFTTSLSLAIGVPLFLGRGLVAEFFGDARVAGLIGILSLNFVLVPFSIGTVAKLQRQLRFGLLNLANLGHTLIAMLATVGLAWWGFGAASLAIGQVVQMVAMVALLAAVEPSTVFCRPVFTGMAPMLRFGSFSALTGVVYQAGNYGTSIILGRMLGPAMVGFFDRGNGLFQTVNNDLVGAVGQVLYVGVAQARDEPAALAALCRRSLGNLAGAIWPGYALLAALADPIIIVMFGPQWTQSVPVLQVLCVAGVLAAGYVVHARLLLAHGRTATLFGIEATGQAVRLIAVLLLAGFGLVAAACGAVIAAVALAVLYLVAARRVLVISGAEVAGIFGHGLVIAVATAALPALLVATDPWGLSRFALAAVGGTLGVCCWIASLYATGHSMAGELSRMARKAGEMLALGVAK